jgi:uncharacterized protein YutE (UPF0331/DUF86 family)
VKAETLELMGIIDKQCLEDITKWRRLRNKVVHDGHTPSKAESEGMLEFALKLFIESLRQQDVAASQQTS